MQRPAEAYLQSVASEAEDAAFTEELERIQARREHEKYLAARGMDMPFSDLNLEDIDRLRKQHSLRYSMLCELESFRDRERFLREETEEAIKRAQQRGKQAALEASARLPKEVEIRDKHAGELALFLQQNSIEAENIENAPPSVRGKYVEILERHEKEIKQSSRAESRA